MDSKILNKGYKYKSIKTKRLVLVKPSLKYKEELTNIYKDKRIWEFNGGFDNQKKSLKEIDSIISKKVKLWKDKKSVSFFIIYNNQLIGSIGLFDVCPEYRNAQIGYILDYNYWNQGLMSEALSEFIKFVSKNTIIFKISATVCTKNKGSIKLLEKNNFKKEGHLIKSTIINNKIYDEYIYSIIDNKKIKGNYGHKNNI